MEKKNLKIFFLFSFIIFVQTKKPNIVLVYIDDQDIELDSLSVMPKLRSLVADKGASFLNSYVTTPLCCPSRSSLLSGRYFHNVGVVNNTVEGGCYSPEWQKGPEQESIAVLLKDEGYVTYYVGKYLNMYGFDETGGITRIPPGYDYWTALKGNSVYYNYTLSVNGKEVWHADNPETDYLTNVVRNISLDHISQVPAEDPFFIMISPPAPHAPSTPEPKYKNSLSPLQVPRTPNFNIVNVNKHWLAMLGNQPLKAETIEKLDEIYRNRLRTLLTVDDMVGDIVAALNSRNMLNDTYIIYTSDHGYHLGHFSQSYGKGDPFETDVKVPLYVKGPGISDGIKIHEIATSVDLSATILDLAGITVPSNFDGISLKSLLLSNVTNETPTYTRTILYSYEGEQDIGLQPGCEFLGTGLLICEVEFECICLDSYNNTFNCIRTIGPSVNEKYCAWQDSVNFKEYMNLKTDPYEITNAIADLSSEQHDNLVSTLDSMLKCSGKSCTRIDETEHKS